MKVLAADSSDLAVVVINCVGVSITHSELFSRRNNGLNLALVLRLHTCIVRCGL